MQIAVETYGHAVMLNMTGELTSDSLEAFRGAVQPYLNEADTLDIVLNLEKVPFIDSAALEHLLDLHDGLGEKLAHLHLVKPDENVRMILELTRLDTAFDVFDDVPEAIRSLEA